MAKRIHSIYLSLLAMGLLPIAGFAQAASLAAKPSELSTGGGSVEIMVQLSYTEAPSAVGWTIILPEQWSLVEVAGEDVPQIAPVGGETGELDFAYTSVPKQKAQFEITVRYPANPGNCSAGGVAFLRGSQGLLKVVPDPLKLSPRAN